MSDKKEQIIESATSMIRTGGYNAFSFREIANSVGVKSSSVHHYFPRKEDLAVSVAERYRDGFFDLLGNPLDPNLSAKEKFERYCEVFIQAFRTSGKACLCGILSHESPALPEIVVQEVNAFIDNNLDWLKKAFSTGSKPFKAPELSAVLTYSALEGAMAVATLKRDVSWLIKTQEQLGKQFLD